MSQHTNADTTVTEELTSQHRLHWGSVMMIWAGSIIAVPSILVGQQLVGLLSLPLALLAGLLGYGLVALVATLQGAQAADLGRPTVVNAQPSFGKGGANYMFSFIVAIALIGWFGIQAGVAGTSFQSLLALVGIKLQTWLATVIISLAMLLSAIYGFQAMKKLNIIATPLLVIVLGYATFSALHHANLTNLWTYHPKGHPDFASGVSIVFGSMIVGGVIAGDFTRYSRRRTDVVKSSFIGIVPFGVALVAIGSFLTVTAPSGSADIIAILIAHIPIPAVALITLILATWTTNVSNAYSAGIALVNGLRLDGAKRPLVTAIAGILGTILAVVGILNYFVTFLSFLTALITPMAGVMIADYWLLNKGRSHGYMEQVASKWVGITAWLIGSIPGILALFPKLLPAVITSSSVAMSLLGVVGLFIAMIVYLALRGGKNYATNN